VTLHNDPNCYSPPWIHFPTFAIKHTLEVSFTTLIDSHFNLTVAHLPQSTLWHSVLLICVYAQLSHPHTCSPSLTRMHN
jgi:hypothetical protein